MSTLDDLKHEFAIMQDCVSLDAESFNETRRREIGHCIERLDATVFPVLERNHIDTSEFSFVFKAMGNLIGKIDKASKELEYSRDASIKEQIIRLHYNLKAMVTQVNEQIQDFELPEGYNLYE